MDVHNRRKSLYARATAVVLNSQDHVLVVRHRGQTEWALPGGQIETGEDPARRAVIEVAQETGLGITSLTYIGQYEGARAAHEIFLAEADGNPRPDLNEVEEAAWWYPNTPLDVQPHVIDILEMVLESTEQAEEENDNPDVPSISPEKDWASVDTLDMVDGTAREGTKIDRVKYSAATAGRVLAPVARLTLSALWALTMVLWKASLRAADVIIVLSLMWEGGRPKPGKHISWDPKLRPLLLQSQNGVCMYCRASLRRKPSDIDHMMPTVRGGSDDIDNLQLLCPGCNRRKSDRTDEEFRWRYAELLPQGGRMMPVRRIRQSEFKALTRAIHDPQTYTLFKSGKYYTVGKKVSGGAIIAGIAVFLILFLSLNNLTKPEDATNLGTACVVVGILAGLGVRSRAWYTGKDQES